MAKALYPMKYILSFILPICFTFFNNDLLSQNSYHFNIEHVRNGEVKIQIVDEEGKKLNDINHDIPIKINNTEENIPFFEGETILDINPDYKLCFLSMNLNGEISHRLFYLKKGENGTTYHDIPLWLSILPPIIAIMMALIFREVYFSLIIGLWLGSFIINGLDPFNILMSFFNVFDVYLVSALSNENHISVIAFTIFIGGMVAVISKNGGMMGVIKLLSRFANSSRNTKLVSWFLGIVIFFDDYANTLIVGNTMRPITDRFRISREKLAYIVDSTAAPVAALAFFTTWIGAELGYIQDFISSKENINQSAYSLFIDSLSYSYYPLLTLIFILMLILMKKDFGPMYKAELRAKTTGELTRPRTKEDESDTLKELEPKKDIPYRWYNALIPIATIILGTIAGLIITGYDPIVWADDEIAFFKKVSATVGNANSYKALLWASSIGSAFAIMLTISQGIMSIGQTMETFLSGLKNMVPPIAILALAWSLASVTNELHTADYLSSLINDSIDAKLLPVIIFILAAFISFSTGSSWGTMAILYPIALPLTWTMGWTSGLDINAIMELIVPIISVVLAGSVLGDHCSPISDTTILSSLASHCNHVDHVNTQMPYAISVGGISIFLLILYYFIDLNFWVSMGIGIILCFFIINTLGKETPEYIPDDQKG